MNDILVSVLVSFYNDTKDLIVDTLQSFVDQKNFDLNNLEVVVVDDGSTVDINHIIDKYKNLLPHFNYIKKEHGDRGSVYEYAKDNHLLHGTYFTILDSDDKWHENILAEVSKYMTSQSPDVITTNFYRWYPTKSKTKKTHAILINKSGFVDMKKKHHLLCTPYSWPIGKFYKTKFFYDISFESKYTNDANNNQNEILFHICPDVVLYYEILHNAQTWMHINKYLSYSRQDRKDSFSNQGWSPSKVRTWAKTINYLTSTGASCHAFFYFIYRHYPKAYIECQNAIQLDPLVFQKKMEINYLPKILHPVCKLFFKIKIKMMGRKLPIKLI